MVDRQDRNAARFPEAKASAARERIARALDEIGVTVHDLGIAQAAAGGDLLFAEACLDRGMRLDVHLPEPEAAFRARSVAFAAAHWQDRFDTLRTHPSVTFRIMPDERGAEGNIYDRCNRWMLNEAMSYGAAKLIFLALWNGGAEDGAGGTADMVALVARLTGRPAIIIDVD